MSSAKIRIKVGSMELEYEGDPSFLTGGIEALLETMGGLASKVPQELQEASQMTGAQTIPMSGTSNATMNGDNLTVSTNTIAANIGAKSGSDLVICAMAHLELVQKKAASSRKEILVEMKNAQQYYKSSMSSNLSSSISTLVAAKRINELAKDKYALTAAERKQIEIQIAQIA